MHKILHQLLFLLALVNSSCFDKTSAIRSLNIAAAADTIYLFKTLEADFALKNPNIRLRITHAASGTLVSQIEQGAPYDLFFSADDMYPRHLVETGHAIEETLFSYGTGELIVWLPQNSPLLMKTFNLRKLVDPTVKLIALANPEHAPYGKLARQVLEKAQLYETLQTKLVFAENVAQALQYVQSGNVDVGLISLSLTKNPVIEPGVIIPIPPVYNAYLDQKAVQISNSPHPGDAKIFLEYLKTPAARSVFRQHGFGM